MARAALAAGGGGSAGPLSDLEGLVEGLAAPGRAAEARSGMAAALAAAAAPAAAPAAAAPAAPVAPAAASIAAAVLGARGAGPVARRPERLQLRGWCPPLPPRWLPALGQLLSTPSLSWAASPSSA